MPRRLVSSVLRRTVWVLPLAAAVTLSAPAGELHMTHGGIERSYDLYVPSSYGSNAPAPLVLALHGRAGSGERMAALTGFNARAEEDGFIVAYPEGFDHAWNYVHGIPGYRPGPNDSEFLLELVSALADRYDIDTGRVYVAGISNGGFMAQRLACYAPSKFTAFASVAASGYAAMPQACKEHRPVNMLYIHGTEDARVPWRGLRVRGPDGVLQQVTMSVSASLKFWSRRNGCGPAVTDRELVRQGHSPGTSVRLLTADDCSGDAEVSLYAILGGGHNWPGSRDVIQPQVAGKVNMDIHASDVIWAFFQRHGPGE